MGKNVVVVGAGAIGGYVGGNMARAGIDVTLIDQWPEHVEKIRAHGLRLDGLTAKEKHTVRVKAMHISDVQSLSKQNPVDIAFICVKSYDSEWAATLVKQYLAPAGFVVSLQNSINEERIASVIGWGRVVGCIASLIAVDLVAPGHIVRNVPLGGDGYTVFRVGEVHGRTTRRIEEVAGLLKAADSVKVTSNLWGERWAKLCLNSMRNGLSAATGLSGNERDRRESTRRLSIRLGGEAVRVGRALGFFLESVQGMRPDSLLAAAEGDEMAREEIDAVLLKAANERTDEQRPSMAQDMLKGRRTETDFINGLVAMKGAAVGMPAPTHEKMNKLVKEVEQGKRKPSPDNVAGW